MLPETGKGLGDARVSEAAQSAQPSIYFLEPVREKHPGTYRFGLFERKLQFVQNFAIEWTFCHA